MPAKIARPAAIAVDGPAPNLGRIAAYVQTMSVA